LAFSKEGKQRRARVPGLALRYALRLLLRIPVLGALLELLLALVRLPATLRHQRVLQEELATVRAEPVTHHDRVAAAVERLRATLTVLDERQGTLFQLYEREDRARKGEKRLADAMI